MPPPQSCFVGKVDLPMRAGEYAHSIYDQIDASTTERFLGVNRLTGDQLLRPGHTLLLPNPGELPGQHMHYVSAQIGPLRPIPQSMINAQRFNQNYDLFDFLSDNEGVMGAGGKGLEGIVTYMEKRTDLVRKDFRKLADLYKQAQLRGIPLGSEQFRSMRAPLEASLRAQVNGIARNRIYERPHAASVKKGFNISHKRVAKELMLNPNVDPSFYTKGVQRIDAFTSKIKHAGTVGKVLSVGSSVAAVHEDFKKGKRQGFRKLGEEVVETAAGGVGATAGAAATAGALLLFGVGTGGVGFIVIGIGAVAGSIFASEGAGWAFTESYDLIIKPD